MNPNVVTTKQEIYDAYVGGESARSLATRHGLSHQRIYQIIREARGLPPYPAYRSSPEASAKTAVRAST